MKKGLDYPAVGVVTMCHNGNGEYLLGLRGGGSRDEVATWSPLGTGAVDHSDTVADTVKKEVLEECGAEVIAVEYIGWYETFRSKDEEINHWVQFVYRAHVNPDQISICEPEKCSEIGWFALDSLPKNTHSLFDDFIERFGDKL